MSMLDGKIAIVTGGLGGVARGIVRHFIDVGAKVMVVDVAGQDAGEAALKEMGCAGSAVYLNKDISAPGCAETIIEEAVRNFGALHCLVNNAHASKEASLLEATPEMWGLSLGSGLFGTFHLMRAAYEELRKVRGSIVNFVSSAGLRGQVGQSTYAAAKEAIRAISHVAANEWASEGIRVNMISPLAMTPGVERWAAAAPDQYQKVLGTIPLGRLGRPQYDIAPVVAFLASEQSQYMTGQTLMVDGGFYILR